MSKVPLTARGAEKLREELERLKRIERPRVIEAIAEARAHGDLKENAEYHAAREQQSFIEGRIKDIDGKLSNAHIIDITQLATDGRVVFGATAIVLELDKDETEHSFQIVGDDEADLALGMISISSPIARALIGKREGDTATVDTPGGAARVRDSGSALRLTGPGGRRISGLRANPGPLILFRFDPLCAEAYPHGCPDPL
jgi:transcription elongation factor GreA